MIETTTCRTHIRFSFRTRARIRFWRWNFRRRYGANALAMVEAFEVACARQFLFGDGSAALDG